MRLLVHAGQFGEGVKVEINRLIQAGCTVHYQTGNMVWQFFWHRELATSEQELLYMESIQTAAQPDTTMIISAPAAASPGQFAFLTFDDAEYLFLRTAIDSYRCVPRDQGVNNDFGLEILYEQRDHGKIFVCDIYVCSPFDLQGFGLNYLGSSQSLTAELGVTRDRSSLEVPKLMAKLGTLLCHSKRHDPAQHARAVRLFLHILHEQPTSALQSLVNWYFDDDHRQDTAKDLYSACQRLVKLHMGLPSDSEDLLLLQPGQVWLNHLSGNRCNCLERGTHISLCESSLLLITLMDPNSHNAADS